MTHGEKQFYAFLVTQLVWLIIGLTLVVFGMDGVFVSIGTTLLMLCWLIYAAFDSRSRWPGTPFWGRIANIFTFRR